MEVTFVGLLNMGAAIVRAHLKARSKVTIWNRTIDKPIVRELESQGAAVDQHLQEAITRSDYLVICLPDHETVYDSFKATPRAGFSKLKAIINVSNGTPANAETMASWAKERQAPVYVAGAVMAGPDNICDRETAFILYSGNIPQDVRGDLENLIAVFGRPEYVGEAVGNAQLYNNASLAATYSLFSGVSLSTAILSKARHDSDDERTILRPFQLYVSSLLKPAVTEVDGIAEAVEQGNEDAMGASMSMMAASVVEDGGGAKGMAAVAKAMMRKS